MNREDWSENFHTALNDRHGGLKAIALALVRQYVKPEETLPIEPDRTHLCKVPADPCGPSGKAEEDDCRTDAAKEQARPPIGAGRCNLCGKVVGLGSTHHCSEDALGNRHEFFIKRLTELGMYDADSDYDGMIGRCVQELSAVFARQRHSGASAASTMGLFSQLMGEWDRTPEIK